MSTVLVFRIGSMGDSLVALPAIRLVASKHQGSQLVLLTNAPVDGGIKASPSHQLLVGSGLVHDFIEFPSGGSGARSFVQLAQRIRALKPVAVYCLMPHQRSLMQHLRDWVFFKIAGIPIVRGLQFQLWPAKRRSMGVTGQYESEPQRLLRSIGGGDLPVTQAALKLDLSHAEQDAGREALLSAGMNVPFIALSLGTKLAIKDWGQDRWLSLLAELRAESVYCGLVLLGVEAERARCQELASAWVGPTVNLCGQLSPRESAAVLQRALVFLGHDSGPMHLANAVGTPTVSVFSSRNLPGVWFPVGNEANVFYSDIDCKGCELEACTERAMKCIRSIEPRNVAARVLQLLQQRAVVQVDAR